LIGKKFSDQQVQEDIALWPFKVIADKKDRAVVQVKEQNSTKTFLPEMISSFILQSLKNQAEAYLEQKVRDAVITVPAYFNNAQREATKAAGEIAGLNVVRIINEPTAASLAFELNEKSVDERNILVFDLGGGTFDVTVLCVGDGNNEVCSTSGDSHLGGSDIDNILVEHCKKIFKKQTMIDISSDREA